MPRADPRTEGLLFMSGTGPTLAILLTYIYFCTSIGPRFMKHRKPYDLKNTLIIYNFIQVLMSLYLVHEAVTASWLGNYNYLCQPVDYSQNPNEVRVSLRSLIYFNRRNNKTKWMITQ